MSKITVAVMVASFGFSVLADGPDFLVEKIRGDGQGWIITDYCYKYSATLKTSRVVVDFRNDSNGKGFAPGPTTSESAPAVFGFWPDDGKVMSCCRWSHSDSVKQQIWGAGYGVEEQIGVSIGNNTIDLDYVGKKATWASQSVSNYQSPTASSILPYGIFTWNYGGKGGAASIYDLYRFRIYERTDGAESDTLVRDFVPCCANGVAALYDQVNGTVLYPTTDGFSIPMTNVTVAAKKRLRISSGDYAPKSLTLSGDCLLVFDGVHTLVPESTVVLPASGTVTVSLEQNDGRGVYTLIKNLPADFDLATFAVGTMPGGQRGTLSKVGTSLVLALSDEGCEFPDALGETLTSDAHGHIETGYRYRGASWPKTTRVQLRFKTDSAAAGTPPGPVTEVGKARSIFGYKNEGGDVSYAWWTSTAARIWDSSWAVVERTPSSTSSELIEVDYAAGRARWNGNWGAYAAGARDSGYGYWLFDRNFRSSQGDAPTPSVYDLYSFRIYETAEDGTFETLVHEFVPCLKDGCAAAFDRLTGAIKYPVASTNGFVCGSPAWRLKVNGESAFARTGAQLAIPCSEDELKSGWAVRSLANGRILASGSGLTASFAMPDEPAGVYWLTNGVATAGQTFSVVGERVFYDFSIGSNAELSFEAGSLLHVEGELTLPISGSVRISLRGLQGPGVYALIAGVPVDVELSRFAAVNVVSGYVASFERHGDRLVLRVAEDLSADAPGVLARSLTTDMTGYIDTGYAYKGASVPKTKRIWFDFSVVNGGRLPTSGEGELHTIFGFLQSGTLLSYFSLNHWNQQVWHGNDSKSWQYWLKEWTNGRQTIDVDYATGACSWNGSPEAPLAVSASDATTTYHLFSCNGNKNPAYMTFYGCRIYETNDGSDETLVHEYLPCVKNGRVGVRDAVTGQVLLPVEEGTGFTADFGVVTQRFTYATTVSDGKLVTTPAFAPQNVFTFHASGSFIPTMDLGSVTITIYSAADEVLSTEILTSVRSFTVVPVTLGAGVRAVVATTLPEFIVRQESDVATVVSGAESLWRMTGRHRYEIMIAADATLTFKKDVVSVVADSYDASGAVISSTQVGGSQGVGSALAVPLGAASWRVLKVLETAPGIVVIIR